MMLRKNQTLTEQAHLWREKMADPQTALAERSAFERWLGEDWRHEAAYDEAVTYAAALSCLNRKDIDDTYLTPSNAETFTSFLDEARGFFAKSGLYVAGSLILVASAALFWMLQPQGVQETPQANIVAAFETKTGETTTIVLPDDSTVVLAAQTRLSYAGNSTSRTVTLLNGAAYFDVRPDRRRPFSVKAGDLRAKALGTQFDVKMAGDTYRVGVAEGRVGVSFPMMIAGTPSNMLAQRRLSAGQKIAAYRDDGLQDVVDVDIKAVAAWRQNKLVYDSATLAEIISDANRYSDRDIVLAQSAYPYARTSLSGVFQTADIDGLLAVLSLSAPLEVFETPDGRLEIRAEQ